MKRFVALSLVLLLAIFALRLDSASAGAKEPKALVLGAAGLEVDGKLAMDDEKVEFKIILNGKPDSRTLRAKPYHVHLAGGLLHTVTLKKLPEGVDPFIIVKNAKGDIVEFAEVDRAKNAELAFVPAKDGTFTVYAAALDGAGPFQLKITAAKTPFDLKKIHAIANDQVSFKIKGKLDKETSNQVYAIKLKAGSTYTIEMKSTELDGSLHLYAPGGKKLGAEAKNGGGNLNAVLTYKAAEDGIYILRATTGFLLNKSGNFVIAVTESGFFEG